MRKFDLTALIERIKNGNTWAKGDLDSIIIRKSQKEQIILTALHEDTEISSYQSNDSITFEIIEGKLRFHTRRESLTLDQGEMLTIHEKVNYSLSTREETVFLLTISNQLRNSPVMS